MSFCPARWKRDSYDNSWSRIRRQVQVERVKSVEVQKFTCKSNYLVPDEPILLDVLLDVSLDASTASRP